MDGVLVILPLADACLQYEPEHRHLACGATGRLAWSISVRQAGCPPAPQPRWLCSASGADSPECESRFGFNDLAVHLKQRVRKKIDRSALGLRIDYEVAALR